MTKEQILAKLSGVVGDSPNMTELNAAVDLVFAAGIEDGDRIQFRCGREAIVAGSVITFFEGATELGYKKIVDLEDKHQVVLLACKALNVYEA